RRPWALAAVAAHAIQPLVAVAGTPAQPRDLPGRAPVRLAASTVGPVQTIARRRPPSRIHQSGEGPAPYDRLLAAGPEAPLEPRRDDCPLCASARLEVRVEVGDGLQRKPGTFHLEECQDCGHVFQNPRLSPEGLDFYYRDFYDGIDGEQMERI